MAVGGFGVGRCSCTVQVHRAVIRCSADGITSGDNDLLESTDALKEVQAVQILSALGQPQTRSHLQRLNHVVASGQLGSKAQGQLTHYDGVGTWPSSRLD
jgi:hypothetical protein